MNRPTGPEGAALKKCKSCGVSKELSEFHKKRTRADGLSPDCKGCANRARSARKKRAPNKHHPESGRSYQLKCKYGITLEQYQEMHDEQGGVCAICKKPETATTTAGGVRMLAVDHNHTTGEVRGLLCNRCNRALGYFGDDIASLAEAIKYLSN